MHILYLHLLGSRQKLPKDNFCLLPTDSIESWGVSSVSWSSFSDIWNFESDSDTSSENDDILRPIFGKYLPLGSHKSSMTWLRKLRCRLAFRRRGTF